MPLTIGFDKGAPSASTGLMIKDRLPGYDLDEIEGPSPGRARAAAEKFRRLIDEARRIVEREVSGSNLEIAQCAGTICRDVGVYRPGIRHRIARPGSFPESLDASVALRECALTFRALTARI